jgi:four helix bundle protein
MYKSFEELDVWKASCRLAVRIYEVLRDCKDYGLKEQMTRSAVSIPSNISEGAERDSKQDFIRFLRISKGSAAELRTQLYIANQIGILSGDVRKELVKDLVEISSMLQGLIKSIQFAKARQGQR